MLGALLLLLPILPVALAGPLSFLWGQRPIVHSLSLQVPREELGWADPRILGGQFIDVSLRFARARLQS